MLYTVNIFGLYIVSLCFCFPHPCVAQEAAESTEKKKEKKTKADLPAPQIKYRGLIGLVCSLLEKSSKLC